MQRYLCRNCEKRFRSERRKHEKFTKQLWEQYIFHKQTVPELARMFKRDPRTIRGFLDTYVHSKKIHHPRPINIITDATYFGERQEGLSWCVIVARDAQHHEDLVWLFTNTETTSGYRVLRDELEQLGYLIQSITGDGFGGIKQAFSGIPYQMCHVHMERIVVRGTTKHPKTEQGEALLALVRTLHQHTDSHTFRVRLGKYFEICHDYLNEKTFNEETGEWDYTHRPLRKAALSLKKHEKYLFAFEHNENIPKTTNSLEGHFSHIKRYVGDHRGVGRKQAERILHSLLLASSVSPDDEILDQIL